MILIEGGGVSPHFVGSAEVLIWPPQWTTKISKIKTTATRKGRSPLPKAMKGTISDSQANEK
jgi:hypothetical protein